MPRADVVLYDHNQTARGSQAESVFSSTAFNGDALTWVSSWVHCSGVIVLSSLFSWCVLLPKVAALMATHLWLAHILPPPTSLGCVPSPLLLDLKFEGTFFIKIRLGRARGGQGGTGKGGPKPVGPPAPAPKKNAEKGRVDTMRRDVFYKNAYRIQRGRGCHGRGEKLLSHSPLRSIRLKLVAKGRFYFINYILAGGSALGGMQKPGSWAASP
jgi:hypothetical protein